MRKKSVFTFCLIAFFAFLLCVKFNTVVRAPDGNPVHNLNTGLSYASIQAAIDADATLDGHTISVGEGIYYEHVVVGKNLTLTGENRDTTVIDGNGTGVVVELGSNVTIANFTIQNGEYGVRVWSFSFVPVYRYNTINNNRIRDNIYGAILLHGCANNTITNNLVVNNTLFGIHFWNAGNNTLTNNNVINNGHGIDFYGNSNDNILRSNNMTNNTYNFGLIVREDTRNWLMGTSSKPGIVNDVDTSNTVNGKPIYYLINKSNEHIPTNAGYVWLNNCTNITIHGCNLSHNLQGVLLLFTNNASVIGNNVTHNAYGIHVELHSCNNTVRENTLEDNINGVYLGDFTKSTTMRNNSISGGYTNFGLSPEIARYIENSSDLLNDVDDSNTVDGKPIIYWIDQHNHQVPENAGYVLLLNSSNILVEGLNLSNNVQNIFLLATNDTVIVNNLIVDSVYGIDVGGYGWFDYNTSIYHRFYSFNTTVKENTLVNNGVGLRITSGNSTISNNTLQRNPLGIYLKGTSNSTVSKNLIVASDLNMTFPPPDLFIFQYPELPWERSYELMMVMTGGIIAGGSHNLVYCNTVRDSWLGISLYDAVGHYMGSQTIVFWNNIINSTNYQALSWSGNYWDNGYPFGGNYWSDYVGIDVASGFDQNETGSDGIGDKDFLVFGFPHSGKDNYPLMGLIRTFDVGFWDGENLDIYIISNSTISNFQLNNANKTVSFNVTDGTGPWFCRVIIPNTIIDDSWGDNCTLIINGQPVEPRIWTDESNAYAYFTIPEFTSFLLTLLIMASTILAVIIFRRKLCS